MFSSTHYNETRKSPFSRGSPQPLYHNYLVPKKNMDGNFLFETFKTQNNNKNTNTNTKNLETQKRQYNAASRLRHRSTFNSFSQQKTIKSRSQSSQGKQFQTKKKNQLKNYIQNKNSSRHMKTSEDSFFLKKSVDLRDPFFGFENPQTFQKIILTKKRFYYNRSPATGCSIDKDQYEQKLKQQTENAANCRGQKCKLLQNYLSQIKRNRDDLVKKKTTITKIKKRISVSNKPMKRKSLDEFLPKLNVYKSDKYEDLDIKNIQSKISNVSFPNITSKSFTVLNGDMLIYGRNEQSRRQIASLTKIMTCITGLFLVEKFQLIWQTILVKVSRQATSLGGTTANLKPGDQINLKDLFYGMMLPSGNDAAYTIGQYFGRMLYVEENIQRNIENSLRSKTPIQSIDNNKKSIFISSKQAMNYFIREINKFSQHLSLINTFFANCHGLSDPLNYSTSNDIAILSYNCIQNSKFQEIIATKQYQSKIYNKNAKLARTQKWTNSNLLLHNGKQQSFGGKTGYTLTAGPCLMTCFKKNHKIMIVVLLGCSSKQARFKQAEQIYDKLKNFNFDNKKFKKTHQTSQHDTKSSEIYEFQMLE